MSQDGTRTVHDDEAYRLPPLRGMLSASRQLDDWVVSMEVDWAARQSNLSELLLDDPANAKNHARAVSGYALYNLRAQYLNPASGMKVAPQWAWSPWGSQSVWRRRHTPQVP